MTISKQPIRKRSNRKRVANHHSKTRHYKKSYWPYLPIALIISLGVVFNTFLGSVQGSVLSYATNINTSSLLSGTNSERAAGGLGALSTNGQLAVAAQNKAADMAAKDYWAHNSPDGSTPWTFISASGYKYKTAGENLAYGFLTSSETIAGWMASPGHRANIMNSSFTEVGFGIINVENFQGNGNQTLVVAMYGSPISAPAPAPVSAPTPTSTTPTTAPKASSPAPTQKASTPIPAETPPADEKPVEPVSTDEEVVVPSASITAGEENKPNNTETKPVSRVQVVTSANVAWTQFALSLLVSVSVLIFLLRHSVAWHKFLVKGQKFFIKHPLLDIGVVAIGVLSWLLIQTSGFIL